jgi:hypothetical protein
MLNVPNISTKLQTTKNIRYSLRIYRHENNAKQTFRGCKILLAEICKYNEKS